MRLLNQEEFDTNLCKAVEDANVKLTKYYLDRKADPNQTLPNNFSLISWATYQSNPTINKKYSNRKLNSFREICILLLRYGANLNDNLDNCALANSSFLIQIIKRGINFDVYNTSCAPIHYAINNSYLEAKQILIGAYIFKFCKWLPSNSLAETCNQLIQCKYKSDLNLQHIQYIVSNSNEFQTFDQERLKLITKASICKNANKPSVILRQSIFYALDFIFPNAIEKAIPNCDTLIDAIPILKDTLCKVIHLASVCKSFNNQEIPILSAGNNLALPHEISLKVFNYYINSSIIINILQILKSHQAPNDLEWKNTDIRIQMILDIIYNTHQNTLEHS